MKRRKMLGKMLFSSIISLLLCVSMLVGTTFAWFTDSVTSGRNTIQAGNLDVVLETWDNVQKKYVEVDSDTKLFNDAALWEPGYTEVAYLKVSNAGSLALEYRLTVSIFEEIIGKTKTGEDIKLSEHLEFKVVESETDLAGTFSRDTARNAAVEAMKLQTYEGAEHALEKTGDADYLALIIYMPESVENEANHNGTDVPSVSLGISLFATQYPYEEDSFDETYDDLDMASSYQGLKKYKGEDGNYILTDDIVTDNAIFMGNGTDVTIDMNGKTIDADNKDQFSFVAQYGAVLRLTGNGTVNVGKGFYSNKEVAKIYVDSGTYTMDTTGYLSSLNIKYHSIAQNNAHMYISGGTFLSSVEDACLFFATSNATIEITGGFFENTADATPDLLGVGIHKNNKNLIILKGGTFVNYNPMDDDWIYTGTWPDSFDNFVGQHILIWEGYTVVSEEQANGDIWYTVVPE